MTNAEELWADFAKPIVTAVGTAVGTLKNRTEKTV
jgi:hypothetical protein